MYKRQQILLCWLLMLILSGCFPSDSPNTPLENELREAFERYLTVLNEAYITFETTELSTVTTGDELENILDFIEAYKELEAKGEAITRSAEEFKIERLEILAFGSSWAVIEVKKNYLTYSENLQTGERNYASSTKWRVQRFLLIKEEGVWKVDRILEGVKWSG